MRYFGHREIPNYPAVPDTALSLLLTANTGQAFDWPANADVFRAVVSSTIANFFGPVILNPSSTAAALPTTGGTISSSVGGQNIHLNVADQRMWQRPRASTGFSVICVSSMSVCMEFWQRSATT